MRVDFNVPLDGDFNVTDNTRLRAAVPSIKKILGDGGSVVLMSHLGRPKSGPEEKFSLKHITDDLGNLLSTPVKFVDDCIGDKCKEAAGSLNGGEVLLLENLRFYSEETKGDNGFAKQLSELGDVYVNDAFGTAHRAHASTSIVSEFFPGNSYFGYVMAQEINNADKVMQNADRAIHCYHGRCKSF